MKYTQYTLRTILQLVFTIVAYVLTPFIVPLCDDKGNLPVWLSWFQTFDASCDAGWQDGYFAVTGVPTGYKLWWLRTRWLWRNPAYGFCYGPLGIAYDPAQWVIDEIQTNGATLTLLRAHTIDNKYFCYTDSSGAKFGYKLWWAFDVNWKLLPTMPLNHGTRNRLMICFTPSFDDL
jgi:hypothetical protein